MVLTFTPPGAALLLTASSPRRSQLGRGGGGSFIKSSSFHAAVAAYDSNSNNNNGNNRLLLLQQMRRATSRARPCGRYYNPAVATAVFKNGDVFGDKRAYRNGHDTNRHHPHHGLATQGEEAPTQQPQRDFSSTPTSSRNTVAQRGGSTGGVSDEGLFASLDDGIVDSTDRLSSSAGDDVVPQDLLLPNPTVNISESRSGGERRVVPAEGEQLTAKVLDPNAAEFNVGDDSRWPALPETSWEFNESTAMARGAMAPLVAPPWRVMLLSDGSVTRHLQLLTDAKASHPRVYAFLLLLFFFV